MIRIADSFWRRLPMGFPEAGQAERFMLWIDAVGGYRVCLGDEVTLGQPERPGTVDVPILGDLSGRHARIRRDGEGYLLEALREVWLDGRRLDAFGWLRDGSRIQLGESVRLLFRKPHALSGTARIEFLSGHRMQPSADAVLLMAHSCILGPRGNSHVVCRDWTREVVLYREGGELFCRAGGTLQIDGTACRAPGRLQRSSRVEGDGFSFNLEEV